jgi:signal transduction histidine kinase
MPKILVIEDDDLLRKSIGCALRKNGFNVLEAQNEDDGFELAQARLPHLILCDLNLEGASGSRLFDSLREDAVTANIPFILMTGEGGHDFPDLPGSHEILLKPFTVSTLLTAVKKNLNQKPVRGTASGESVSKTQKPSKPVLKSAAQSGLDSAKPTPTSREHLEAINGRLRALQEQERSRLARIIHDELIQDLSVVAIELSLLNSTLNDPLEKIPLEQCRAGLSQLSGLVDGLIKSAQRITAELRPKVLDEFGLAAALEWLGPKIELQTGAKIKFKAYAKLPPLDSSFATEIYRVAKEILLNLAQCPDVSAVAISVEAQGETLRLKIEPDGNGITGKQLSACDSLGWLAMRDQIELLGGKFSIPAALEKGAVTIQVPMKKKSARSRP